MEDFEQLDHYQILGISRSASDDEIKQAYRQQMRRYHPDRVASASPAEQAYATQRALRINAAYQTLSDRNERLLYNRTLSGHVPTPPRPQQPARPRDHQAELYERAHEHLDAGRTMQAVATLRELQQLNPFYRDSAALLAQAEAQMNQPPPAPAPVQRTAPALPSRRTLIIGGASGLVLALFGGVTWWMRRTPAVASPATPTEAQPAGGVGVATATAMPATATSAPAATATRTPSPTPAPTATRTPTPTPVAETGRVIYSENFRGSGWPSGSGSGWSVGAGGGAYTITSQAGAGNIWVYRTSPGGADMLIGVDVTVRGGEAGLIVHFTDRDNYLAFFVDPAAGSFRLELRSAGQASDLLTDNHPAIQSGTNRLVARLEGEEIIFRINGQQVAELPLSDPPPSQRYGLVAVSGAGTSVEANFEDLQLRALR
ncbi:heat shock protein DnaJ domain-containing protein [Oscillochloris trichoides DG-6]|uniref:Heat shock protein DnaJ domain-containing protein n=1 Tax=Oscillochloris trichoides DG-6 TaxID=765420 RepID=E1IAI1_9CHLR|nr:heat shock protein DnaJ domain-containing protein [Oscillochloris trichoides DG-6]